MKTNKKIEIKRGTKTRRRDEISNISIDTRLGNGSSDGNGQNVEKRAAQIA